MVGESVESVRNGIESVFLQIA